MNIFKKWFSSRPKDDHQNQSMTEQKHPVMGEVSIWTDTAEGREFVKSLAKDMVVEVAPEELPLFDELAQEYFDDPTPPDLSARGSDDPLGTDFGQLLAETPAIIAMIMSFLTFLSTRMPKSSQQASLEEHKTELRNLFSYQNGLQQLLNRIPSNHARYSEALVYQQRLIENIARSQRFGETSERRSERAEIIEQLNDLALDVYGEPFNALCGMRSGLTPVQIQQMRQQAIENAQQFGIKEIRKAEQMADSMVVLFLSVLWGEKDDDSQ